MGLLLDLSPDGGMDDDGNEDELEAELLSLVGSGGGGGTSQGKKGDGRGEKKSQQFFPILYFTTITILLSKPYGLTAGFAKLCINSHSHQNVLDLNCYMYCF